MCRVSGRPDVVWQSNYSVAQFRPFGGELACSSPVLPVDALSVVVPERPLLRLRPQSPLTGEGYSPFRFVGTVWNAPLVADNRWSLTVQTYTKCGKLPGVLV